MPQVIPIVIAAAGAYVTTGIQAAILTAVFSGAAALASRAMAKKPSLKSQDLQHVVRSSVEDHKIIYGEAMVSGPLALAEVTGSKKEYVHLVIPLAGHEVEAIGEVYLNDKPASHYDQHAKAKRVKIESDSSAITDVTISTAVASKQFTGATTQAVANAINADGEYSATAQTGSTEWGYIDTLYITGPLGQEFSTNWPSKVLQASYSAVRINKHLGSDDQAADPDLVAEVQSWTTNHRLRGIAYIYVRLEYSRDVWPMGLPNIKAVVKGRKVYDPRTATTAWSNNWALCVRDYLTAPFGFAMAAIEVDDALVVAAANICDEQVATPASTQKRYTCDGVISLGQTPADNLDALLPAAAGSACFAAGQWRLYAGAFNPSVMDLDEDDLRGAIRVLPRASRKDLFNGVRGVYVDPAQDWQTVDFPPVTNPTYETEDGGEQILQDIELPFTNDPIRAQRIGKIILERGRQGMIVEAPVKLAALELTPMATVRLSIARLGWTLKEFRVLDWELTGDGGIDLVLQEEAAGAYAWNGGEATEIDLAPNTNLPDPWTCPAPTGLLLESGTDQLLMTGDGTIISRIKAIWTPPENAFVTGFEVEFKRSSEADWTQQPAAREYSMIAPVQDGQPYDVRVRAVNSLGVRSAWLSVTGHTVVGKSEPPPAPSQFLVARQPDGTREFSWSYPVPDPDHAGFRLRYKLGSGATWAQMSALHEGLITSSPWESNQLAAGSYTFGLVAVDTTGNESAPVYIEAALADPRMAKVLQAVYPRKSGWPGTKTDCWVDNNDYLLARDTKTWSDFSTDGVTWSAWLSWVRTPVGSIIYEEPAIDLGAVVTVTPLITALGDGNPTIEVSTSSNGSSWSAWSAPALVTARYLKVRVTLAGSSPVLKDMVILISAETEIEELNDLNTATLTGAYRIAVGDIRLPIQTSFAVISQLSSFALQNVGSGWSWVLIDKDTSVGPRVRIYNASGQLADAVIDAAVKGVKA